VTLPAQVSNWHSLLTALASSDSRISLVVTGGGSGAVSHCLRRAGASRNFVDAVVPYSRAAVAEYLGCPPAGSSASSAVAKQLASVALRHATSLDDSSGSEVHAPAGIALVAALPTTPPRQVPNRIHVVLREPKRGVLWSLELTKQSRTREEAETIAEEMVYRALAELSGHADNESFFANSCLDLVRVDFEG
jgi:hypothetical protein